MLRYVHRRIKEIAEKTYTILDAKRSWTCEKSTINQNGSQSAINSSTTNQKPNAVTIFQAPTQEAANTGRQAGSRGGEEKCHHKDNGFCFQETWLSALTWSGALICGWYASQLLCLHRRHLGWDSRCYYSHLVMQSGRAIHSRLFTHVVFASPFRFGRSSEDVYSGCTAQQRRSLHHYVQVKEVINDDDSGVFSPKLSNEEKRRRASSIDPELLESHEESFDLSKFILTISGDDDYNDAKYDTNIFESAFLQHRQQPQHKQNVKQEPTLATNNERTVGDAAKELQEILGQIEFELGVKAASVGDFAQSFSHFKLATAHEHSGATFNLGVCFEQGIGVKQDMNLAMECYDAAARLGHPKAIYNLGVFYATGLGGLRKNRKAARRCFIAAAHLGQIEAKIALGMPLIPQEEIGTMTSSSFAVSPIDCAINHLKPVLVS